MSKLPGDARVRSSILDTKRTLAEELLSAGYPNHLTFHTTSMLDHTVLEAFSRVIQHIFPKLLDLGRVLDNLVATCSIEKALVLDLLTKMYFVTDSSPVDIQIYELFCNMVEAVVDISDIYEAKERKKKQPTHIGANHEFANDDDTKCSIFLNNNYTLILRQITSSLMLVALIHKRSFQKVSLLEYNCKCFKEKVLQAIQVDTTPQIRFS
uniref:Ras-related GTP-binding protein D n=1 Tax=Lygus hesperus TaxID=30085 RepID=A0A0A9X530_LYGHE